MDRLYGTLELRAVDDEERTFTGIANTSAEDDHGTVVEPAGARVTLPLPLLWHHDQKTPVGEVTEARLVGGKWHVKGQIRKVTEPGKVKDATDEAWHSVKYQLVRGLSIGFKELKRKGNRFTEWLWRELSLVTIPSNMEANILAVRSAYLAASGEKSETHRHVKEILDTMYSDPSPGVTGTPTPKPRHGKMTIAEQIAQHENTRAAKVARKEALITKAAEEGRTLDESESQEFDHIGNARQLSTNLVDEDERPLWILRKERPDSPKKIDAAMGAVLAWEARNDAIAAGEGNAAEPSLTFLTYA